MDIETLLAKAPLLAFSPYTHAHVAALRRHGRTILTTLDDAFQGGSLNAELVGRAYGDYWLWVLGTFEVLRTLDGAKSCLSDRLGRRVAELKGRVVILRAPFAKLELAGKRVPISLEPSIFDSVDFDNRDMIFSIGGVAISMRGMINEFDTLFNDVVPQDILRAFEERASRAS